MWEKENLVLLACLVIDFLHALHDAHEQYNRNKLYSTQRVELIMLQGEFNSIEANTFTSIVIA